MVTLRGTAASPGIAFGRAVVYLPRDLRPADVKSQGRDQETARLDEAIQRTLGELSALTERVKAETSVELAHIFRSQQTMMEDDSIRGEMNAEIAATGCSAEAAVEKIFGQYRAMFEELGEQDYNRARIADLEDVRRRLMRKLLGVTEVDLSHLDPATIVVAPDMLPSDTAVMDRANVCGMITETGGITSHTAILAKTLGIPAAVSVAGAAQRIAVHDEVILDSSSPEGALVYVNPDWQTRDRLGELSKRREERKSLLAAETRKESVTPDGHRMILSANIGSPEDLDTASEHGVTSVGLFRTEFLFMKSARLPTEEEQYDAYRAVCNRLSGGMVIIRTLDAGGDKAIPSLALPREANPFLGYRALRVSLDNREMFKTQLRAALRASAGADVRIMFPMVCGLEDWQRARAALEEARGELAERKQPFNDRLQVGVMVEIPSAVLMADELAAEVDFMSIGTNDLTQYLLAADRMNEHVSAYYRPFHPAVFRAIHRVVEAAHRRGRWVGVCGELAGMPMAVPVLMGIGVDELSMSPRSLPEARHVILRTAYARAQSLAQNLLTMKNTDALEAEMRRNFAKE